MSHASVSIPHESSENNPSLIASVERPTRCYFMVVDILGFSKMIGNLNSADQAQRITEWLELVQRTGLQTGVKERQLISDSLFVREEDSADGLARLLSFAQLLLERGVDKSLPLRGAIVHGDAAWGQLPFGQAVIQAHELEQSLDWIGIACAPNLPRLDSMWNWDLVVVYPVPRKSGETRLMPAISWKVPSTNELIRKVSENGLMEEGEHFRWDVVVSKLERTIQFGIYLMVGKSNQLEPQRYRFWFPMHLIEELLKASG